MLADHTLPVFLCTCFFIESIYIFEIFALCHK